MQTCATASNVAIFTLAHPFRRLLNHPSAKTADLVMKFQLRSNSIPASFHFRAIHLFDHSFFCQSFHMFIPAEYALLHFYADTSFCSNTLTSTFLMQSVNFIPQVILTLLLCPSSITYRLLCVGDAEGYRFNLQYAESFEPIGILTYKNKSLDSFLNSLTDTLNPSSSPKKVKF